MMFYDFKTTTHGKWILAGEHAVIRGHAALVFPIIEKKLILHYSATPQSLSATYSGESGSDMHLLFWSVIEQGVHLLGESLNNLSGQFELYSNIPIGVGMGASAALCMAVARWFCAQGKLSTDHTASFARELEHLFHGQSSGLDIAGVSTEHGILFQQGNATTIQQAWHPHWCLSSSGQVGITSHCIQQVQTLWENNPQKAEMLDKQMADCVQRSLQALKETGPKAQDMLAKAINQATVCFQEWGLISESLQHHMYTLKNAGAIAVKPTGSGGGGYVVSLWPQKPPVFDVPLIDL